MRIPPRFNGPPGSANGGYTCGLVAVALGVGPAEVSLRAPPPLDRDLSVSREGDCVTVRDGETVIAQGQSTEAPDDVTEPVDPAAAGRAACSGYEGWTSGHPFPTCVVCGPDHEAGMQIYPGPLGDGRYAASWRPGPLQGGAGGRVPPEIVWAALDCPTSAPGANWGEGPPIVLARLTASIDTLPSVGEQYALVSWALRREGRKREAACVLFDADGSALARSRALWIELREE